MFAKEFIKKLMINFDLMDLWTVFSKKTSRYTKRLGKFMVFYNRHDQSFASYFLSIFQRFSE